MEYNPRTATGIPTEPVGSIPRPLKLQQAYADYDAKKITKDQLEQEQDTAVADTLKRFEATGSPIITDGEQRVSSFATYPIADTLAGTGLAPNLAPGGQYFAIFADGHNRQLPKVTGGPFRYNFYAGELVKKAVKMTSRPLHQAVIAPSMMYLLYPLDGDLPGYSRKQFEDDIVNECEKDIRSCLDAGAAHVVMDFTEGRLAPRNDPRNPWTTRNLLPHFIELDNRVFDRFSPEERKNIGVHVCPGGDVDSVHSADVPYEELLKHLFKLNAGYFQMQMASERDRDSAYKLVGKYLREDAKGHSTDGLHRLHRHAEPTTRIGAGGVRSVDCRSQIHRQRAPRLDGRLWFLAVQHRQEAQSWQSGLRPRHCVPENNEPCHGNQNGRRKAQRSLK